MTMRYVVIVVLMALTCLDVRTAQGGESADRQRESLHGLPGVEVVIKHFGPELEAAGFSKEQLLTAVELTLRSSGIRVLSKSERFEAASAPFLYVHLNPIEDSDGNYCVSMIVLLYQRVSLVHGSQTFSRLRGRDCKLPQWAAQGLAKSYRSL